MAKQALNTIKNWFKTGLKPTQSHFWDTWDSFWHKDDKIPTSSIENLDSRFDGKADVDAFLAHLTDPDAHAELFNKTAPEIIAIENEDVFSLELTAERIAKFGEYPTIMVEQTGNDTNWSTEIVPISYSLLGAVKIFIIQLSGIKSKIIIK